MIGLPAPPIAAGLPDCGKLFVLFRPQRPRRPETPLFTFQKTTKLLLFNGVAGAGASGTFSAGEDYGFYLINQPGDIFYSQAGAFGTADSNVQHFAFFKEADHVYYLGIEDFLVGGDTNYNDMVVKVSAVPEPASVLLLGAGMLALTGCARRKFKI